MEHELRIHIIKGCADRKEKWCMDKNFSVCHNDSDGTKIKIQLAAFREGSDMWQLKSLSVGNKYKTLSASSLCYNMSFPKLLGTSKLVWWSSRYEGPSIDSILN